jgi:hypothetical protein
MREEMMQQLIDVADRLADAVARHYRAVTDSANDIDASREEMFACELEYDKLRAESRKGD